MKFSEKFSAFFLHRGFARVSPFFSLMAGTLCAVVLLSATGIGARAAESAAAEPTATIKRRAAEAQFDKAEEQRAELNSRAIEKRTLAEYKQVVSSYKKVYLISPHAADASDSILAMAELYTEMGDRFGRSYYQSAVESYQFLVKEYPTSKYTQDAYMRAAKLQRDQLGEPGAAAKTYQDFLKRYPRAAKKREIQEALAELALLQSTEPNAKNEEKAATKEPTPREVAKGADDDAVEESTSGGRVSNGSVPHVKKILTKATAEKTRITIDLEGPVQYASGKIANPDRIYFDLHAARLTPEIARGNISVSGDLLTGVRVAQNQAGVVRVVLDVTDVKDYTASLLNKPYQLLIDLYAGPQPTRAAKPKESDATIDNASETRPVSNKTETAAAKKMEPQTTDEATPTVAKETITPSKGTLVRNSKNSGKPDLIKSPTMPQPTRDGQSTLTRALGLKIGRIVIDAGHGGHDTGTIGPTGLMEKDLCLDVALRLGKIVQQKLPGADVVFTRSDDTFIPLEERTRIANEAKADLFISVHANSSRDSGARGIETYYLNLKGSAEAMEVAARENASSQEGVHDLQDLVKRIARTEKVDESKEFAEEVQNSLSTRIQKTSKTVKNRGVRKAPFVVLIGADMPSILTEISFLSNPSDEQLLKKPDHRQRVAEGIYQGMATYLQSMNSMTVNMQPASGPGRKPALTTVQESRNQN